MDEFQDTSYSQFELLQRLTPGWESGDGRTLFLVGDPMQSIYRFREAEVGLFLNAWEQQRLGQVSLVPLELSANFRSSEGIVNWVNHCFDQVMVASPVGDAAPVPYTPSVPTHFLENDGVSIHPFFAGDYWGEAQRVLTLVKEARKRGESVAVLARAPASARGGGLLERGRPALSSHGNRRLGRPSGDSRLDCVDLSPVASGASDRLALGAEGAMVWSQPRRSARPDGSRPSAVSVGRAWRGRASVADQRRWSRTAAAPTGGFPSGFGQTAQGFFAALGGGDMVGARRPGLHHGRNRFSQCVRVL
ncbi:MAG: UvrD-helicase domain-containing protein [Gammaproteobacteria bacterium]